jgi:hypothetical protein
MKERKEVKDVFDSKNSLRMRPLSGKVNPSPRLVNDLANELAEKNLQQIIDGILGEDFLIKATQQTDLTQVTKLEIKVNSTFQSLLDLNLFLPNLRNLVLDSSIIVSIRDLGVGLRQLSSLRWGLFLLSSLLALLLLLL